MAWAIELEVVYYSVLFGCLMERICIVYKHLMVYSIRAKYYMLYMAFPSSK